MQQANGEGEQKRVEEITAFFEDLNEVVYITDIETDEVVYMNKKNRAEYGGYPMEHYVGRKCYELFQKSSARCKFCTNHLLAPGKFVEWQYYNPIIDRTFMIKDGMIEREGRQYRVEIALDISNENNSMFKEYQAMEAIANEGFRLALQEDIPDKSIEVILEYIGKALNGERSYIFEQDGEGYVSNTYEWVRCGSTAEKANLQKVPMDSLAGWYRYFREKRNVMIEDLEAVRDIFPEEYKILKPQKIQNLVVVPLLMGNEIIGFYGVDNPNEFSLEYVRNILKITSNFIVSSLRRRKLYLQLREMSHYDYLTRLGNRYAMQEFVENIPKHREMGVLYCDVTGLKRINDEKGHDAGDKLLINGADSLKRVFGAYDIFRIGGDEFLVLCSGIGEGKLVELAAELKNHMKKNGVIAAVGTAWQEKPESGALEALMMKAENQMYADKAEYYRTSGIDRRR